MDEPELQQRVLMLEQRVVWLEHTLARILGEPEQPGPGETAHAHVIPTPYLDRFLMRTRPMPIATAPAEDDGMADLIADLAADFNDFRPYADGPIPDGGLHHINLEQVRPIDIVAPIAAVPAQDAPVETHGVDAAQAAALDTAPPTIEEADTEAAEPIEADAEPDYHVLQGLTNFCDTAEMPVLRYDEDDEEAEADAAPMLLFTEDDVGPGSDADNASEPEAVAAAPAAPAITPAATPVASPPAPAITRTGANAQLANTRTGVHAKLAITPPAPYVAAAAAAASAPAAAAPAAAVPPKSPMALRFTAAFNSLEARVIEAASREAQELKRKRNAGKPLPSLNPELVDTGRQKRVSRKMRGIRSAIEERHPSILQTLMDTWNTPESLVYLRRLLLQDKGGRLGVDPAVKDELLLLSVIREDAWGEESGKQVGGRKKF